MVVVACSSRAGPGPGGRSSGARLDSDGRAPSRTRAECPDFIATVNGQVQAQVRPLQHIVDQLDTIPRVNQRTAQTILAEIGADLSRFPTAGHLASWAGICPGNNESAGKHHPGRTRKGDTWLRATLVDAAAAASKTKGTYLRAQYPAAGDPPASVALHRTKVRDKDQTETSLVIPPRAVWTDGPAARRAPAR